MDIDDKKLNQAYHDLQIMQTEIKKMTMQIQTCIDDIMEAINKGGKHE